MNKKIVFVLILIITFCLIILISSNKTNKFNDLIISEEQFNNIIINREKDDNLVIKKLKFNNNELFLDNSSNTWYYSLIEKSQNAYNPVIEFKSNNKNISISILENNISKESIKNNDTIEIIIFNKTKYNIYHLKCTTLPMMNIKFNDTSKIESLEDTKMSITLFDNRINATQRTIKSDGQIHVRGVSTIDFPKKGYKISLETKSLGENIRENNISLLGMRQDDDWILYAGYNDQDRVRNVFASNLWYNSSATSNYFNIKNGIEYKYIELFINNKYWGLYALGFPIDDKQLEIKNNEEYIFKKIGWSKSENISNILNNTKLDNYEIKSSYIDENIAWDTLKNYYINLNAGNINNLYNIVDIDNNIDYYLFTLIIQGCDNPHNNYLKNVYISFKKNSNNKLAALYTPWDLDLSFGNVWDSSKKNKTFFKNDSSIFYKFNLNSVGILLEKNDLKIIEMLYKRYNYLRLNEWSNENILKMLEKYEKNIFDSGAFDRDIEKWPNSTYDLQNHKLSNFKKYVLERLKYTDEYISNLYNK